MQEKQAGISALVTAYSRAYHAVHDEPKIFDDFLADSLFSAEEHTFFDFSVASLLPLIDPELAASHPDQAAALALVMQLHNGPITLSRSRYAEDGLEEAVRQGVQQFVILGAGFDTFAFRRPELADQLRVFEVDHPATQTMKQQRIASAGWPVPPHLYFVPVDFTQQTLMEGMKGTHYDSRKPTFFSWLGVTYYLSREAVETTLDSITQIAPSGSILVFDYMDPGAFNPGVTGGASQSLQIITRQIGEPLKTGFDPLSLPGELKQAGFHLLENLGPSEIETRYFQGRNDRYHAASHIHLAKASVL